MPRKMHNYGARSHISPLGKSDPDQELLRRAAAGDAEAMRKIIAVKLPRIMALSMRMLGDRAEAEDVAEETFFRIWKHAAEWKPGAVQSQTWVFKVTANLCTDRLHLREPRLPTRLDTSGNDFVSETEAPEGEASYRAARALNRIAPQQRQAIILVYYGNLSNIGCGSNGNQSRSFGEFIGSRPGGGG